MELQGGHGCGVIFGEYLSKRPVRLMAMQKALLHRNPWRLHVSNGVLPVQPVQHQAGARSSCHFFRYRVTLATCRGCT
jgi:hypothetical protein